MEPSSSTASELSQQQTSLARKITPRVAYAVSAVLLIAIAVLAAQIYASVRRELTDVVMERRGAVAQLAAATLSERLDRMTDVAVSLATRVRFAELVSAGQWEAAAQILRGVPAEFRFLDRVVLYDVQGNLMADVPELKGVKGHNFAYRDWYQGVSRSWRPYISEVYRRAAVPQRQVFAVAVPIADRSGAPAGILQLQIHLETFFDWAKAIELGAGGAVYVVDGKGTAAFDGSGAAQAELRNLSANPAVAQLLKGRSGVELAADPADGAEYLYAYVPSRHGWGVAVLQPVAEAFAARENQLWRLLIGYAVILAFCAAIAGLAIRLVGEHRRARADRRLMDELERRVEELKRAQRSLAEHAERLRILREIDRALIAKEAPKAIAAAVIQPLRELLGVPRAIVNEFDIPAGEVEWIAAAGRHRTHVGAGVRYSIELMGDLDALRRGEPQRIDVHALPPGREVDALLASGVHAYMAVPMIAGGELIGALSFGGAAADFSQDQLAIAQEAATQLAIAIAHARLHERVVRQAEELEQRVAERTAALASVNGELEDLYNKSPCGYHSVDENGLIVRMNDTWLKWLGYSREEVVGKMHHPDLMSAASAELFRSKWFPLFKRQGWLKEVEFEYVRKDGTTFPGSLQTSTIYDAHGRYVMSRTTVFDISARRRMEDALRDSNAFLDSIIENIPDMIFVKESSELRLVRFNRAGEALLGYSKADLLGKNDYDLFPKEQADFFTAKDREVLAGGRVVDIAEEPIHTRERGARILHTKKIPVLNEAGRPRYLLGISEDITERKAAEERIHALNDELQTRAVQLEAVNKELESFSYSVSHDLRAPLRAVDGYAQMLEEDYAARLDDEGRRLLGVVRESSRKMGQLIDDLLAFSKLGRQQPAKRRIDMSALAREVADELGRGSPATIELPALPDSDADRALLKQAWSNLIDNALKYSATRARPHIEIAGREDAAENVYWVRDNGVGFDMRYAAKLFGVFQRLHRADEFPGTGVGLAIVQRVIARHGGRVWAEGRPGEGACFYFSLPRGT